MARIIYNKLVRDRIPQIIAEAGKDYLTELVSEDDYQTLLLAKLQEEAAELTADDNLEEELADIFEVLDAIITAYGLSTEAIKHLQDQKRSTHGGFEKRIKLLWVEDKQS